MDREILFRGRRTYNGEWLYGLPDYGLNGDINIIRRFGARDWVDPNTMGQFTGFPDKNKKKIFEGDILEVFYDDLFPENSVKYTVLFHNGAWCIKADSRDEIERLEKFDCDRGIVVGNIYDNKEE
jgi:uncharacterized phage protein (TIGR01671 family)